MISDTMKTIRDRRKTLGVSQKLLAQEAGMSQPQLAQLETGVRGRNVSLRTYERLTSALERLESKSAAA